MLYFPVGPYFFFPGLVGDVVPMQIPATLTAFSLGVTDCCWTPGVSAQPVLELIRVRLTELLHGSAA